MSHRTVQLVIGRLLTDEDWRTQYLARPRQTLAALREQGYELTRDEIDALAQTDADAWRAMAGRIHPRLQRCKLV